MHTDIFTREIKDYINWRGDITITDDEIILSKKNNDDIIFPIKSDIITMRIITGKELESYGIREVCGYTFVYMINMISKIKYVYK